MRGRDGAAIFAARETADVAKLADAQPSEGCARKGMEVQLLSSAPIYMKPLLILLLLSATAHAQVVRRSVPTRAADVNDKSVETTTLQFGTIPQTTRTGTVVPLSGQRREAGKIVTTKTVETPATLRRATVPGHVVPQANFTAKNATVAGVLPPSEIITPSRADIEKRVIYVNTPEGVEELKRQFNPR